MISLTDTSDLLKKTLCIRFIYFFKLVIFLLNKKKDEFLLFLNQLSKLINGMTDLLLRKDFTNSLCQ